MPYASYASSRPASQPPPTYSAVPPYSEHQPLIPPSRRKGTNRSWTLAIALGLISAVLGSLLMALIEKPQLFLSDQTCQGFIRDWEKRVGKLEYQHKELRMRLENLNQELKERLDWEENERARANLYWGEFHRGEQCTSYGHRMYHAQLLNLDRAPSINKIEACRNTTATINNIPFNAPLICEDKDSRGTWGSWLVGDEVSCNTYWAFTNDKGCSAPGSGLRRYETKLGTVTAGEDPELLCYSTPLTIKGQTYSHPLACPDWGEDYGIFGIWNIPDENCR